MSLPEENIRNAFLATFSSPILEERQQAERYLNSLSSDLSFIVSAFQIIGKNKNTWSIQERQAFAVFIKNTINSWSEDEIVTHFPTIKDRLIELLFDVTPDVGIRKVVVSIVRKFLTCVDVVSLNIEEYIFSLLQSSGNDLWKMQSSLVLMNEFTLQMSNRNSPTHSFMDRFGPLLLQLYIYLTQESMKSDNVHVMVNMRYNIIKSLWHCIRKGTPESWKKNLNTFKQWNEAILGTFKSEIDVFFQRRFPPSHYFFKEKRLIAHIVYSLYLRSSEIMNKVGRRGKKSKPVKVEDQKISDLFLQEFSVKYMETFIEFLRSYLRFEQSLSTSAINFIPNRNISILIVYLDSSVSSNNIFNNVWKPHLQDFFRYVLFPFIEFKKEDFALMTENPNDFLFQNFEDNDDIYSIRISTAQVFYELLGYRNKAVIGPFMQFVSSIVSDPNATPQMLDGVLYLILHLKKVLDVDEPNVSSFLEKLAVDKVFQYTQSDSTYLAARSVAFLGEIHFLLNPNALNQAAQLILNAMRHENIIVKTQAAIALSRIISVDEICENIKPLVPDLLKVFIQVMGEIENSTLIAALSAFGSRFSEEMQPYALETCASTVDMFMRLVQQEDEDEDGQIYDACTEALRTLYTLLNAVLQNQENSSPIFRQLEEKIIPLLLYILNDTSLSFFDQGMEILTLYTYKTQNLSENIWRLFPEIMKAYYEVPLYDFINNLLPPLDNFISYGTDVFLSNPEYVKAIFGIIANYLNDFEARESICQPAVKLLSVLFQNCLGRMDYYYADSFKMVLNRLSNSKTPALKILLLDAIGDMVYYNPKYAFEILESTHSVPQILHIWFQTIEKMTRLYDKKITCIGLCRLLEVGLLTNGSIISKSSAAICKNILNLLSNIQHQREEMERKEQELEREREMFINGSHNIRSTIESMLSEDGLNEEGLDGLNSEYMRGILEQIQEIGHDDYEPKDDVLDDEIVSTPLDDIDEFNYFGACMLSVKNTNQNAFNQFIQGLDNKSRNGLEQLMQNVFRK